jgi:hypothetical protein
MPDSAQHKAVPFHLLTCCCLPLVLPLALCLDSGLQLLGLGSSQAAGPGQALPQLPVRVILLLTHHSTLQPQQQGGARVDKLHLCKAARAR